MLPADVAPDRIVGERWAIDEIFDGVAKVLAARAVDPTPFTEMVYLNAHASELGPDAIRRAHQLLVKVEAQDPDNTWTEEVDHVMPIEVIEGLVANRSVVLDTPGPRPLREGDAFWVAVPNSDRVAFPRLSDRPEFDRFAEWAHALVGLEPDLMDPELLWRLVASEYGSPLLVWDVTVAARIAVEYDYELAVRAADEALSRG